MTERRLLSADVVAADLAKRATHPVPSAVNLATSPRDGMLMGGLGEHYVSVGLGALTAIQSFARLWGIGRFTSILDFGCGHGRVLRWLRAAYPDAIIVGSDIDEDGVAFCASEFGAIPAISSPSIDATTASISFDAIFAGSVITHLPENSARLLLDKFASWLNPGGLAVITSHGATAVSYQLSGAKNYHIGSNTERAMSGYFEAGYGYGDYPTSPGYGVSFVKPAWFYRFASNHLAIQAHAVVESAWDRHHDILSFQKRPA